MKRLIFGFIFLTLCLFVSAQTVDLGSNVFFSEEGPIKIVADAAVAVRTLDSPYIMFVLYMGTDEHHSVTVTRENVVMDYQGKEYHMPSLEELHKNYGADDRDWELYQKLGKDTLALSDMRFYRFPMFQDFFPQRTSRALAVDEGSFTSIVGFKTRVYFKNPGLKKGDTVIIKVVDKKDSDIWGAVAVQL